MADRNKAKFVLLLYFVWEANKYCYIYTINYIAKNVELYASQSFYIIVSSILNKSVTLINIPLFNVQVN